MKPSKLRYVQGVPFVNTRAKRYERGTLTYKMVRGWTSGQNLPIYNKSRRSRSGSDHTKLKACVAFFALPMTSCTANKAEIFEKGLRQRTHWVPRHGAPVRYSLGTPEFRQWGQSWAKDLVGEQE